MGSVPPGLSFDLRPPSTFVPKTITDFLFELSTIPTAPVKLSRLHDFLARLEEEYRKIDAFKRELPLSMRLLNDAIVVLQKEAEKCRVPNSQPVLEEFMPLKKEWDHNNEEINKDKECRDKKNWLSSVQLCTPSTNNAYDDYQQQQQRQPQQPHRKLFETKRKEVQRQSVAEDPFQSSCSNRNGGRSILPFSPFSSIPVTTVTLTPTKEEKEDTAINNRLSLMSSGVKSLREGSVSSGSRSSSSNRPVSSSPPSAPPSLRPSPLQQLQASRKQRRCWSPELHRRFVNALQKLGGPQVATPKQIRELMQVDGLTNDEVKSHLQKYRLHTRRVPAASANEPVAVLRGLWMSEDQYNDSSKGSSSGSGSPKSPLHLTAGSRGVTSSPTEEGDSMENDEDARSDISLRIHIHKPANVDV